MKVEIEKPQNLVSFFYGFKDAHLSQKFKNAERLNIFESSRINDGFACIANIALLFERSVIFGGNKITFKFGRILKFMHIACVNKKYEVCSISLLLDTASSILKLLPESICGFCLSNIKKYACLVADLSHLVDKVRVIYKLICGGKAFDEKNITGTLTLILECVSSIVNLIPDQIFGINLLPICAYKKTINLAISVAIMLVNYENFWVEDHICKSILGIAFEILRVSAETLIFSQLSELLGGTVFQSLIIAIDCLGQTSFGNAIYNWHPIAQPGESFRVYGRTRNVVREATGMYAAKHLDFVKESKVFGNTKQMLLSANERFGIAASIIKYVLGFFAILSIDSLGNIFDSLKNVFDLLKICFRSVFPAAETEVIK